MKIARNTPRASVPVVLAISLWLLALACAQGASAAPVSVSRSGWAWSDPAPQGESLNRVVFDGARGYAVGETGTVLRSDDAGSTWVGLASGTSGDLDLLQEIEPNVIVVGGGCVLRASTDAGASFHRLPVNESETSCASKIASFSFLSPTTGFIEQSDGTILMTSDGGQTVEPRTAVPLAGSGAGPIAFVSPDVGLAVGAAGGIYRTSDAAGSWTKVASSAAGELSAVTFATPTVAYAVGANGSMLTSSDAGETWTSVPLAITPPATLPSLSGISCSDALHCLITTATSAGAPSSSLLRTADGGLTAALITPSEAGLTSVAFASPAQVVTVGLGGATALSSDGGQSFPTQISHGTGLTPGGPITLGEGPLDAYVPLGAGELLATTNGGESWSTLRVPTSSNILDLAFPTTGIGYALSEAGTLYRSPSSGLSWSILGSVGEARALLAPSPSTLLLIGPFGIRRSTSSGAAFTLLGGQVIVGHRHKRPLRRSISRLPLDGAEQAGKDLIAYGSQLILESGNGGVSWSRLPIPMAHEELMALDFLTPSNGYAVASSRLFHTADAGRHWQELGSVGGNVQGTISFSSPTEGYVVLTRTCEGCSNPVLHTLDGGRSWTPELLPRSPGSLADAGSVAYGASAGAGGLFETRDGGLSATPSSLSLSIAGARRISAASLKKAHGSVRLNGHLSPAEGGETVEIDFRSGGGVWHRRSVTVAASGAFTMSISGIHASTQFVAKWLGEGPVSGAGTAAVTLTVLPARRAKT